jgi:hypothetical protein
LSRLAVPAELEADAARISDVKVVTTISDYSESEIIFADSSTLYRERPDAFYLTLILTSAVVQQQPKPPPPSPE